MLGEDGVTTEEDYDKSRSFQEKSVWARISVIAAGPIFNFILAFIMSVLIIGMTGYDAPVIGEVDAEFPAAEAGLLPGDKIVKMNDEKINIFRDKERHIIKC